MNATIRLDTAHYWMPLYPCRTPPLHLLEQSGSVGFAVACRLSARCCLPASGRHSDTARGRDLEAVRRAPTYSMVVVRFCASRWLGLRLGGWLALAEPKRCCSGRSPVGVVGVVGCWCCVRSALSAAGHQPVIWLCHLPSASSQGQGQCQPASQPPPPPRHRHAAATPPTADRPTDRLPTDRRTGGRAHCGVQQQRAGLPVPASQVLGGGGRCMRINAIT